MIFRWLARRLSYRSRDKASTEPASPHPGLLDSRVLRVNSRVELQGVTVAEGISDLTVADDHSWSAFWSSSHPWPGWELIEGTLSAPDKTQVTVRFDGITPTLEGVVRFYGAAPRQGGHVLQVQGEDWPSSDMS